MNIQQREIKLKQVWQNLKDKGIAGGSYNTYEEWRDRKVRGLKADLLIEDEFSPEGLEESARIGNEKHAEEEKAENTRDKEYCRDHKKVEKDEIDVSKLDL